MIEEVMKMEVLPVQNQFQGQFGVMGASKIKGKQQENILSIFRLFVFFFIFSFIQKKKKNKFSEYPFVLVWKPVFQLLFLDTFSIFYLVTHFPFVLAFLVYFVRFSYLFTLSALYMQDYDYRVIKYKNRERERKISCVFFFLVA